MDFKICLVDVLKPPRAEPSSPFFFFHLETFWLKNVHFCCQYKIVTDAHRSEMQAWWTAGTGTLTGDTWGWSCGGTEGPLSRLSSLLAAADPPGCFPSGISPGIVARDAVSGRTRAPAAVPDGKRNFLSLLCCTFSADLGLYKPK